MLAGLVRRKLAAAEREVVKAGGKTIEVVRARMMEAGRRALEARKATAHERNPEISRADLHNATAGFLTATAVGCDSRQERRRLPDNMPQAITVTDARGRRPVYVPIRIGGKIVVPAPAAQ